MMKHSRFWLSPLVVFMAAAFLSCDSGSNRIDLNGRYLLTMETRDQNCAWNLLSGEMVIEQSQEDIVLSVRGSVPPTSGIANPEEGSFSVAWTNEFGGESVMDGAVTSFDTLRGSYHATRPDTTILEGCWLDANWKAERL